MKDTQGTTIKDKRTWFTVGVFLFLFSSIVNFAPAVFAQDMPEDEYMALLRSVYSFVLRSYVDEMDPKVLYEGAVKGMFQALGDPYSIYLNEAMVNDLNDTTTGEFGGLGLYIQKIDPESLKPGDSPFVEIVSPIEDTPGWRAGIHPGDRISEIDGEDTSPLTMDEVLKRLRGKAGTDVTITIKRGDVISFTTTITRAKIEVPTVKRDMLPGGTAYIRIIEFTPQTPARVKDAIEWFKTKDYKSMVIDLRNNPGGLLDSVISVADLFLTEGIIVSTKSRLVGENVTRKARGDLSVPKNIPIIVLINKGSASASEILAGALKDQKRAYLIGERSYGKGSVQQIMPLGEGTTGFKLTMSRYYTPSDANIDKTGIEPDLTIAEAKLTPEEEASLTKIINEKILETWVKEHPEAGEMEQSAFVRGLRMGGITLQERLLRKLLRNELQRTSIAPVYDLDYDLQLQEALKLIASSNLAVLIAQGKTVRELQAAAASAAANAGSGN